MVPAGNVDGDGGLRYFLHAELQSCRRRSEAATPRHAAATENQRARKGRQTSTPPSPLLRFVFPQPVTLPLPLPLLGFVVLFRSPRPPLPIAGVFLSCRVLTSTGLRHPAPPSRSAWPPPPPRCPSDPQVLLPRSGLDPPPSRRLNRCSLVAIRLLERLVAPSLAYNILLQYYW
ncbi:hypothetical protein SEVIR_4G165026v4 [Setaria viridis]